MIMSCSNDQSIKVWKSDLTPVCNYKNQHASFIYSFACMHDNSSVKQSWANLSSEKAIGNSTEK